MSNVAELTAATLLRNPHKDIVTSVRHRVLSAISEDDEDEKPAIEFVNALIRNGDLVAVEPGTQPTIPTCLSCGCTEEFACDGGCGWAEPGRCTRCVGARR